VFLLKKFAVSHFFSF
jgi:hypothetical protein